MYSDMSMRTIASSESNRKDASALHSSVLPTPVGPMNMKLPNGLLGSASPARERCTASVTAVTAAGWPTTRAPSTSSSSSRRSRSLCMSLVTGMPVQRAITSPMSVSVTSSAMLSPPEPSMPSAAASASSSCFCNEMSWPYLSSAALLRSYSRSACPMATLTRSISSLMSDTRETAPRVFEVEHVWETRADWEAWLNDRPRYISNLPQGVYQMRPQNKEGIPETFVPFLDPELSPN
mmetsp:Transcript_13384/g.56054  ORF Transcript_13384/g.56054 Transcript_13384/m.56054 type:complete len:236 (-) Transcript_13384:138-845(-)